MSPDGANSRGKYAKSLAAEWAAGLLTTLDAISEAQPKSRVSFAFALHDSAAQTR